MMDKIDNDNMLQPDTPLTDPGKDRLGYAQFASHLADSICKMTPPEGLVIAIYGVWGSGKTTLLKFVEKYIDQKTKEEKPIIMNFNPWWFSGHEDLTKRFFNQLQASLRKWRTKFKNLLERLPDFADAISEVPIPIVKPGAKAVKAITKAVIKDVPKLKEAIANGLRDGQKRVLIIIDDIDRLTSEEIRQLFCVIKAVADFPNVVYLLAFDKDVVVKALQETQGIPGEAYLEKIVQVPFELPLPDKISLRQLLFERLDVILANSPSDLFDETYWGNVYYDGIDYFINTPRDIVRLVNTLSVTYPAVAGEVNPVDFIAIEAIRVFDPSVYDTIRRNSNLFAGHVTDSPSSYPSLDAFRTIHRDLMERIKIKNPVPVKSLLSRIFPKFDSVQGGVMYGSDWDSEWRKQCRICSPEIFPIYFRLTVPEGDISTNEIKNFIEIAKDSKAFEEKLLEFAKQKRPDGTSKVRILLERLEDYTDKEIPDECIQPIVKSFFNIGDHLLSPEDEGHSIFESGNDVRMGRIIWQLLKRLDELNRFNMIKESILNGKSISTIVHEITVEGQRHGKYGVDKPYLEEDRAVNAEHLKELESIVLEKVRNAAQDNSLLQTPHLSSVLYRWSDWASGDEVKQWIDKVIKDDNNLVALLEKFLQKTSSQSMDDRVSRFEYKLNPKWLEPFTDINHVFDRVNKLVQYDNLTDRQKIAIKSFIREYNMIQQGLNPDSPFDRKTLDTNRSISNN